MLCYGLAMPLAGQLIARFGTPPGAAAGHRARRRRASWTRHWRATAIAFLLAFGVLLSVGLAFTSPVALTPVISHWFTRQRGMALFFLSTGSMAGMAIMTPVLTLRHRAVRLAATLVGFAVRSTALTLPAALFVMRDGAPEHTDLRPAGDRAPRRAGGRRRTPQPDARDAMRTAPFWMIFFGLFACGFSMNLLGTHGMPMLMDHGFDAHDQLDGHRPDRLRRDLRHAGARPLRGPPAAAATSWP